MKQSEIVDLIERKASCQFDPITHQHIIDFTTDDNGFHGIFSSLQSFDDSVCSIIPFVSQYFENIEENNTNKSNKS